jgi:hypothetical protein
VNHITKLASSAREWIGRVVLIALLVGFTSINLFACASGDDGGTLTKPDSGVVSDASAPDAGDVCSGQEVGRCTCGDGTLSSRICLGTDAGSHWGVCQCAGHEDGGTDAGTGDAGTQAECGDNNHHSFCSGNTLNVWVWNGSCLTAQTTCANGCLSDGVNASCVGVDGGVNPDAGSDPAAICARTPDTCGNTGGSTTGVLHSQWNSTTNHCDLIFTSCTNGCQVTNNVAACVNSAGSCNGPRPQFPSNASGLAMRVCVNGSGVALNAHMDAAGAVGHTLTIGSQTWIIYDPMSLLRQQPVPPSGRVTSITVDPTTQSGSSITWQQVRDSMVVYCDCGGNGAGGDGSGVRCYNLPGGGYGCT